MRARKKTQASSTITQNWTEFARCVSRMEWEGGFPQPFRQGPFLTLASLELDDLSVALAIDHGWEERYQDGIWVNFITTLTNDRTDSRWWLVRWIISKWPYFNWVNSSNLLRWDSTIQSTRLGSLRLIRSDFALTWIGVHTKSWGDSAFRNGTLQQTRGWTRITIQNRLERGAPNDSVHLVNMTPISQWFIVHVNHYSIHGVYGPSYNCGGSHCRKSLK